MKTETLDGPEKFRKYNIENNREKNLVSKY